MTLIEHRRRARRRKRKEKLVEIIKETRVLYQDRTLALIYNPCPESAALVLNALGTRRVQMLHEVWSYNPKTKVLQAFKNRGLGQGLVEHLTKTGINVRTTAARVSDAASTELKFASDKDEFLFKLKYSV